MRGPSTKRGVRWGAPWLAVGSVLLLLGSVGAVRGAPFATVPDVGYAHAPSTTQVLSMNLTDAPSFAPRFLTAAPGTTLDINLTNNGTEPHSFTLSNQSQSGKPLNRSDTPAELNASFALHPPTISVPVPPGASKWANFSIPSNASLDSFEFVSIDPYQFQAGMWGYLNITSSAPPVRIYENTTDPYSFQPAILAVEHPTYPVQVKLEVTNLGTFKHTFTLSSQPNVTVSGTSYFKPNNTLANFIINGTTGAVNYSTFTLAKPGIYEYVCLYHFSVGMIGYLYVGVPVPYTPTPSSAIVDTWILAGSAILLGIGVALVAVGGFVGRFPRPPPS